MLLGVAVKDIEKAKAAGLVPDKDGRAKAQSELAPGKEGLTCDQTCANFSLGSSLEVKYVE